MCKPAKEKTYLKWPPQHLFYFVTVCTQDVYSIVFMLFSQASAAAVYLSLVFYLVLFLCLFANLSSNGFVLANNVSQDGLWILMWLSWLDMALGLKNDRQTDISSWYAIIRCDELYRVQIPWTGISVARKKNVAICIIGDDAEPHVIFGPQTYINPTWPGGQHQQVPIEVGFYYYMYKIRMFIIIIGHLCCELVIFASVLSQNY